MRRVERKQSWQIYEHENKGRREENNWKDDPCKEQKSKSQPDFKKKSRKSWKKGKNRQIFEDEKIKGGEKKITERMTIVKSRNQRDSKTLREKREGPQKVSKNSPKCTIYVLNVVVVVHMSIKWHLIEHVNMLLLIKLTY